MSKFICGYRRGLHLGSQHFTLTIITIIPYLSLLSVRIYDRALFSNLAAVLQSVLRQIMLLCMFISIQYTDHFIS